MESEKRRRVPAEKPAVDMEMVRALEARDHAIDEGPIEGTPDDVFDLYIQQRAEANKTYEQSEKDLIVFVETQIDLMNKNLLFGTSEPSFYELNRVLAQYETVSLGLTSLYASVRQEHDWAQEKYDDAYAVWFIQERESIVSLDQKKMPSTREIDMIVRSKHLADLAKLKAAVIGAETKRSTAERLCKNWESYQWILSTISKNCQAEAMASGVSARNLPLDLQDQ
jgi:hypothetical protein